MIPLLFCDQKSAKKIWRRSTPEQGTRLFQWAANEEQNSHVSYIVFFCLLFTFVTISRNWWITLTSDLKVGYTWRKTWSYGEKGMMSGLHKSHPKDGQGECKWKTELRQANPRSVVFVAWEVEQSQGCCFLLSHLVLQELSFQIWKTDTFFGSQNFFHICFGFSLRSECWGKTTRWSANLQNSYPIVTKYHIGFINNQQKETSVK